MPIQVTVPTPEGSIEVIGRRVPVRTRGELDYLATLPAFLAGFADERGLGLAVFPEGRAFEEAEEALRDFRAGTSGDTFRVERDCCTSGNCITCRRKTPYGKPLRVVQGRGLTKQQAARYMDGWQLYHPKLIPESGRPKP